MTTGFDNETGPRHISNRVFPESGITTPFHSVSHHGSTPSKIAGLRENQPYHMSLLAYFLRQAEEHAGR